MSLSLLAGQGYGSSTMMRKCGAAPPRKGHVRKTSAPPRLETTTALRHEMLADGSTRMTIREPDNDDEDASATVVAPAPSATTISKHVRRMSAPASPLASLATSPEIGALRERLERQRAPSPLRAASSMTVNTHLTDTKSDLPTPVVAADLPAAPVTKPAEVTIRARAVSPKSIFGGGNGTLNRLRWWRKKPTVSAK